MVPCCLLLLLIGQLIQTQQSTEDCLVLAAAAGGSMLPILLHHVSQLIQTKVVLYQATDEYWPLLAPNATVAISRAISSHHL